MFVNTDWTILKRFAGNGMPCFSYQDAKAEFPDRNANYLSQVLGRMVDEGMLVRLGPGLFAVVPLEHSAEGYLPDWHLTAKYLMQGKPYYVGYYSAMQLHGLITQPSLSEIIVTNTQVKPGRAVIKALIFSMYITMPNDFLVMSQSGSMTTTKSCAATWKKRSSTPCYTHNTAEVSSKLPRRFMKQKTSSTVTSWPIILSA